MVEMARFEKDKLSDVRVEYEHSDWFTSREFLSREAFHYGFIHLLTRVLDFLSKSWGWMRYPKTREWIGCPSHFLFREQRATAGCFKEGGTP